MILHSKFLWRIVWCVPLMEKVFFIHEEHVDWRFGHIMSHCQQWHRSLWYHHYLQIGTRQLKQYDSYQNKMNCILKYGMLMKGKNCMCYGLWSIAQKPVQTSFCWYANSCKAERYQVSIKTTMLQTTSGDIILDCWIKAHKRCIARISSFKKQALKGLKWQSHQLNNKNRISTFYM